MSDPSRKAEMPGAAKPKSASFDAPAEAHWHRLISEAAYRIAQRRGFGGDHALDDWLAAEREVHEALSAGKAGSEPG